MSSVPFAVPDIGEEEIEAVVEVLRSRWLTTGARAREFEQEFAQEVGASHAVAVNSCTAALHLSLDAMGVADGDVVFMSPYTFTATAEVVRYLRARPVFVDIDPATLNVDPLALRTTVDDWMERHPGRPKAIMPVHIAGVPCDMDSIWAIARDAQLAVIEDAAHAFPAAYRGRPVGSVPADINGTACFSFYATKTITTGEGGMLTTESEAVAERARTMSLHGLSRHAWSRYAEGGSWAYDVIAPGFKYNLTDVAAAMGVVQLRRAGAMRSRRREIAARYTTAFGALGSLECPEPGDHVESAWHLYLLRLQPEEATISRDELIVALSGLGIGTSVHFIPLHLHSYYAQNGGYRPEDFPVALREFQRVLSLPIYSSMTDDDVQRVIDAVVTVVGRRPGAPGSPFRITPAGMRTSANLPAPGASA